MIDTEGAQRALTLIATDMDARQRLLAHYRGDEDPVSALRELLDPAQPSAATIARLERAARLQSVAYGRTDTTEAREAAARAQDELAWDRAHAAEIRDAIEAAVTQFLAEQDARGAVADSDPRQQDGPGSHATAAGERRHRRRSIRTLWLAPIMAVTVVCGGLIGGAIAGGAFHSRVAAAPSHAPTPKPSLETRYLSTQPIDKRMAAVLTAITDQTTVDTTLDAERWFVAPQTAADRVIPQSLLGDVTASSMRLVISNRDGTGVWIGKPSGGGFCLFDFQSDGLNGDCTATTGFLSSDPLKILNGDDVVLWDGRTIIETVPSPAF